MSANTLASAASTAFFPPQVHFFSLDDFAGHEIHAILEDGEAEEIGAAEHARREEAGSQARLRLRPRQRRHVTKILAAECGGQARVVLRPYACACVCVPSCVRAFVCCACACACLCVREHARACVCMLERLRACACVLVLAWPAFETRRRLEILGAGMGVRGQNISGPKPCWSVSFHHSCHIAQ
eukprot:5902163-Pleurochrysis_carterae.AAC.1